MDKIKELVEQSIKNIEETGIDTDNVNTLNTLMNIYKNINDNEYLKSQKEALTMRYRNDYNEDFGARRRDSRGRYMRGDRDMDRRYSHHRMPIDYFERMMDGYEGYMDGMEEYNRGGSYGAKDKGLEALEYMLDGFVCFFENLQESMDSPEEVELIKKYARKIKEM